MRNSLILNLEFIESEFRLFDPTMPILKLKLVFMVSVFYPSLIRFLGVSFT